MTDPTSERRTRPLALLALLLAGGWILSGALFKLLQGSPALLPGFMRDLPISLEVIYPTVIGVELAVVAIAWLRPRPGWALIALQYLAFFGVLGMQIAGGEESCGCMGSEVTLSPWQMLAIDGALFALLIASRPWSGIGFVGLPAPLVAAAALILIAIPWFGGRGRSVTPDQVRQRQAAAAETPSESPVSSESTPAIAAPAPGEESVSAVDVVLEPAEPALDSTATTGTAPAQAVDGTEGWTVLDPRLWIGLDIFSLDVAQWLGEEAVAGLPFDGLWVFYRQQCDHCRDHLLELANTEQGQRRVGLIQVPEPSDRPDNSLIVIKPEGPHVVEVALPAGIDYVISTPAEATVEGGIVVDARENIQTGG